MNKKGFAKTLEATIAIILILTFIFYFTPKSLSEDPSIPVNVMESQSFILEQISTDPAFRNCILQDPPPAGVGTCEAVCDAVNKFVRDKKPFGYSFACEVCASANTCTSNPLDVSLYTDSVFLSGTNPKVVRIYFWTT